MEQQCQSEGSAAGGGSAASPTPDADVRRLERRLLEMFDDIWDNVVDPRDALCDGDGVPWIPVGSGPGMTGAAGIPFAFCSLGTDDPKSFVDGIAKAVDGGLPRERAIEALTRIPAAFLGLERALGSIEPGKIADFFLSAGDPLTKDAKIRFVFTDGRR